MFIGFPPFHHVVAAIATAFLWLAPMSVPNVACAETPQQMDILFSRLAEPDGDGWMDAEADILRIWSRTGSAALDLIEQRGEGALDNGDYKAAIGHLTALTDHAPDFALGWTLRGGAFYFNGDYGPAAADLARALTLEPRNFLALTQLGVMLEEMGNPASALAAFRRSLAIHPHQQEALDAVERLERQTGGTEI